MIYVKFSPESLSQLIWDDVANQLSLEPLAGLRADEQASLYREIPVATVQDISPSSAVYGALFPNGRETRRTAPFLVVNMVPLAPVVHPSHLPLPQWVSPASANPASVRLTIGVPGLEPVQFGFRQPHELSVSPPVIDISVAVVLARRDSLTSQTDSGPYSGERAHLKITLRFAIVAEHLGPDSERGTRPPQIRIIPWVGGNRFLRDGVPLMRVAVLSASRFVEIGQPIELALSTPLVPVDLSRILNVAALAGNIGGIVTNMGIVCTYGTFYVAVDVASIPVVLSSWGGSARWFAITRWTQFYQDPTIYTRPLFRPVPLASDRIRSRPRPDFAVSVSGHYFASLFNNTSSDRRLRGRWEHGTLRLYAEVTAEDACFIFDVDVAIEYTMFVGMDPANAGLILVSLHMSEASIDFDDLLLCVGTFAVVASVIVSSGQIVALTSLIAGVLAGSYFGEEIIGGSVREHEERINRDI